ncbi:surfeit locus protein 6-domain-containing protein [Calycina marina]|uniref:Surfeit locus protein 6-domain-containing protein n=1 Tax=Calycina marina TaxID=1763456 RepID=A0A9P7Z733_9HELO|nr:surfeit locus protein 6-domain-containing protein [Calycina marina]
MTESSLEGRLRGHAASFDGLLSLIPAKHYYAQEDTSDQWKKKKQTKQQAAAARKAKLDPDSAKSAKDVMDERARKRKLEELDDESDVEGVEKELPRQGLKKVQEKKQKKQKTTQDDETTKGPIEMDEPKALEAEKRREKAERKQQKLAEKKEKKKGKQVNVDAQVVTLPPSNDVEEEPAKEIVEDADMAEEESGIQVEIDSFDAEGLEEESIIPKDNAVSPDSTPLSPTFDTAEDPSSNTSTTSIVPASSTPKFIKLSTVNPEVLRERLAARIEELRRQRKADGPDGAPAKNRQELMEARRKKEEQRRAHKKELRMKAKQEEEERREAALSSARDSPASIMMSPSIRYPDQNFSFGRVAFADGQHLSDNLSTLLAAPKRKGPQDPATALQAAEKRRLRVAGFDEEKRADIKEKDLWLNAKKRAQGTKVRDDSSLLKKTLKRKEKQKKKSEKEWGERKEGIAKGIAMKQKKREENLQKRRDGSKKGLAKGKIAGKKGGKPKVKSRPGFEGSFGGKKK